MTDRRKGEIMMATCGVLWSVSGVVMKYIDWSPLLISGGRGIISAMVVYISMLLSGYKLRATKRSLGISILTFTNVLLFVSANKMTTAANAIVLQYTAPIFVLIFTALILKRKLKTHEIGTVLIACCGVVLFFVDKISPEGMIGNIFATISGVFIGMVYTFTGEIKDAGERISGLVIGHIGLAVVGIPLGYIYTDKSEITTIPILLIVFLGLVQMGIPYALYGRASALISGVEVSLISMIEPILNPVWVALFYHEVPGKGALIGAVLIISAVILYTILDSRLIDENKNISDGIDI